jgi:hypothetical protein
MIRKKDTQRGAILLLVVFLIFLTAMLMIYLSLMHGKDLEIAANQMEDLQALYCADVGIQRALYDIRKTAAQPNWPGGGRSVNTDPYGCDLDPSNGQQCPCVTNIPGAGAAVQPDPGDSIDNPAQLLDPATAPPYHSRGEYQVRITEYKANAVAQKEVPGNVYRYLMITSTARLIPPSNHQRSVTVMVRRSAIQTFFPWPNLSYYTEIRYYQEN